MAPSPGETRALSTAGTPATRHKWERTHVHTHRACSTAALCFLIQDYRKLTRVTDMLKMNSNAMGKNPTVFSCLKHSYLKHKSQMLSPRWIYSQGVKAFHHLQTVDKHTGAVNHRQLVQQLQRSEKTRLKMLSTSGVVVLTRVGSPASHTAASCGSTRNPHLQLTGGRGQVSSGPTNRLKPNCRHQPARPRNEKMYRNSRPLRNVCRAPNRGGRIMIRLLTVFPVWRQEDREKTVSLVGPDVSRCNHENIWIQLTDITAVKGSRKSLDHESRSELSWKLNPEHESTALWSETGKNIWTLQRTKTFWSVDRPTCYYIWM